MTLYTVSCESKRFKRGDIVRTINTSFTGMSDLVADVNDPSKKEWILCCDMEKIKEK